MNEQLCVGQLFFEILEMSEKPDSEALELNFEDLADCNKADDPKVAQNIEILDVNTAMPRLVKSLGSEYTVVVSTMTGT
eukprot:CAMPEP_0116883146 /NCGR_PEP_ID=MMETSP0463-20121206/15596_1 /TAXON_ID=181622 /ORGANISM="Strombidinopsis sp, Strain SopsisLIS2011" /LENGTH=78 /DNA_ID=CAMNT_0004537475 /DNA_START=86 /DNA_END=322 /DNA_ORIENTATION=-